MATTQEIAAARKRLEENWNDGGSCDSCGWHACLYEHEVSNKDIEYALDKCAGVIRLSCLSQDSDDSGSHRGIRIFIGPNDGVEPRP